ncbi:MAG TPA: TIGR00282 family metallophosphoesterase [Sphaerochaeta sp.]|jgi:metallophosphoesterase (TIGR00282 family)|nr:TIGR00282 family metallophosphoesterase [Spirochaetota bacterium]HOE88444.1 TIGR00282 family metallophosphoesterase [Sphaerochaeta sp.]HOR79596.1 TIGR00282 family metallophosphoesterase [Sphaerochaeta sp.]HPK63354.1 TIGR00282 family metallophosphoesterase [Sphaerochaeta sp.]
MSIRVLFLGEIVGKAGVQAVRQNLRTLREEQAIDLVIANGEGATGGFGLGKAHSMQLLKSGIDVLTGGEKIYYKLDMVEFIDKNPAILRPANFPQQNPGRGVRYLNVGETKICVINILGNADFPRTHLTNAFPLAEYLVTKALEEGAIPLVQFHASPTAEKQAMGFHLAGKAAAVIGTHSKVLTSDEQILDGGTAFISDNGRCGSQMSVGGFEPEAEIEKQITQLPVRSKEYWEDTALVGVIVEIDETGKATAIEPIRSALKEE